MAATSTISSKGQITVPAAYRKLLDLDPGSRVEFDVDVKQCCIVLTKADDLEARLSGIRSGFSAQTKEAIERHRGKTVAELKAEYLQSEAGQSSIRDAANGQG
jgi:AbrB family looped-hinge helix DNA binding protein